MRQIATAIAGVAVPLLALTSAARAQPCEPRWSDRFATADVGGWNGDTVGIHDLFLHDDGSGPALCAAGEFEDHNAPGEYLARWDGQKWSDVHGGLGGGSTLIVTAGYALAAYGDSLYVRGDFTRAGDQSSGHIARLIGCNRCAADCDGNGFLALPDFLCFRNHFTAGDPRADFDGGGAIDLNDFIAFRNAYGQGC